MRRAALAACFAALFLLAVAPEAGAAPRVLRIAYTAETDGNLLPCSCPGSPLGGLDRRIGFLDSLRAAPGGPLLMVDAGRFLPGRDEYPLLPLSERPRLLALHASAAEEAGYDAIVLEEDPAGVPVGPRWLRPNAARIVEKAGLRIAVVAADERTDPAPAGRAVRALGETDVVVLLCSGDLNFALRAAQATGAMVAVVSRGALLRAPLWQEGILFLGPGQAGKYVGVADCEIAGNGEVTARSVRLRPMNGQAPASQEWKHRVEQIVLGIERDYPSALSRGE